MVTPLRGATGVERRPARGREQPPARAAQARPQARRGQLRETTSSARPRPRIRLRGTPGDPHAEPDTRVRVNREDARSDKAARRRPSPGYSGDSRRARLKDTVIRSILSSPQRWSGGLIRRSRTTARRGTSTWQRLRFRHVLAKGVTRPKPRHRHGRNRHVGIGARVAAPAGRTVRALEHPEAVDAHILSVSDPPDDQIRQGLDRQFGLSLAPQSQCQFVNKIRLVHRPTSDRVAPQRRSNVGKALACGSGASGHFRISGFNLRREVGRDPTPDHVADSTPRALAL